MSFHQCISLGSASDSGLKSEVVCDFIEKFAFWEKRPLMGKFSKFQCERIHRDTDPRLCGMAHSHRLATTNPTYVIQCCLLYTGAAIAAATAAAA